MKSNRTKSHASLSEFRVEQALANELPYWDFNESIVVLSDGTLATALSLNGKSIETLDDDSINQIAQNLRGFLNGLPDETELSFMVDVNSNYQELIRQHRDFADVHTDVGWIAKNRCDNLQTALGGLELVKTELFLFVYIRPDPTKTRSKNLWQNLLKPPAEFHRVSKAFFEERVHALEQSRSAIIQSLLSNELEATVLSGSRTRELIYAFLNPSRAGRLSAPSANNEHRTQEFSAAELQIAPELALPSPREQLACSDLLVDHDSFILDDVHHRVLTLKTLPEFTHSALITKLLNLPFHYTLQCHLKVPAQSAELNRLQAKRRMAHSMSMSHGGRATDLESEAQLNSSEDLLREILNTGQKILYSQIAILLRATNADELELKTRAVLSKFREMNGAEAIVESVAGFPAWKTLLPCGTTKMLRPKRVKTDNLADLLPIYQDYTGEGIAPVCLFRNRSGGLVRYDPFDSKLPNYNSLVTGSSGAGKSFLNNLVLLQYMTEKPKVYVIDIGGSYKKLCEFLGGQYVEIRPPNSTLPTVAMNPLQLPQGEKKPSPEKIKFLLAMLENILSEADVGKLPKLERSLLEESLIKLYESSSKSPTLSDLMRVLKTSPDQSLNAFAKILYSWTGDRPYGKMLDREDALVLDADFVVFDLKGLSSYPDLQSVMILIITDFIMAQIESKADVGRRKQILMDECWELLKSPASSSFMEYCVRTLRKAGAGITFITQGLDEIVSSPIGGAIIANTATKFILMQRGDLEPLRRILKLNEQELHLISSLRQQKGSYSEAFLICNDSRTVIRAVPSPIEYWLATSDPTDNAKIAAERLRSPERDLKSFVEEFARIYPFGYANAQKTNEAV